MIENMISSGEAALRENASQFKADSSDFARYSYLFHVIEHPHLRNHLYQTIPPRVRIH